MKELKPCPFCGEAAELSFSGHHYIGAGCKGFIIVKCTFCGGAGKGFFYQGPEIDISLEETIGAEKAINSWNKRIKNNAAPQKKHS